MLARVKTFFRRHLSRRQINFLHKLEAMYWSARFGFPARSMVVFGITGTKGKTTASHFLTSILEEAGYTVGMATTVDFQIGDEIRTNQANKSVLHPKYLQSLLKEMKEARCNVVVLEVTSHAIDQNRIWGIPIRFAGFTNLGHDHLDYHGTMEIYRDTKKKLFMGRHLRAMAANADDVVGKQFLEQSPAPRKVGFSTEGIEDVPGTTDMVYADKISANSTSATFTLINEEESERVQLQLPGRFNVENALLAASLALNLNLKLSTIAAGLQRLERVAGRLESIETKKGFTILIDYAHTPDSLEKLYSTLRPDVRGRMIGVLGCTGDRDKTKRPIMGALAARFCDLVYITDEEPYSEDPSAIIEEVARGVPRGRSLFKPSRDQLIKRQERPIFKKEEAADGEGVWWWKVPERRDAIERAIKQCRLDDVVLLTGMGAQEYKIVGTEKVPWSDRDVVMEILKAEKLVA